ncbi:hypothetical protein GCM10020331_078550 [Ectobacillus funiculus]
MRAAKKALAPNELDYSDRFFSEFNYAREAIRLGADNYLLKPVSPEELEEALQGWLKNMKKNTNYFVTHSLRIK